MSEIIAKVLELIRRIWGAVGPEGAPGDVVFARAVPKVVRLTEHYEFEQEISRNPSLDWKSEPVGKVEIEIPYDGSDHFGRQARKDVEEARKPPRPSCHADEVRLGHLLFYDYGNTDLGRQLGLADSYGAMPLCVPMPDDVAEFGADRFTCAIRHDYAPDAARLKQYPMDVDVELLDPDNAELPQTSMAASPDRAMIDSVPRKIVRQVSFRSHLQLRIVVTLHLPKPPKGVVLQPKVSKVSLDWPTITSLRGLHLSKGRTGIEDDGAPIWYNPLTRSIEWDEVPMYPVDSEKQSGDVVSFRSVAMNLWIKQPGELYSSPSLDGIVEVEIKGYLLSGMQARLSDAGGRMPADRQPELKTTMSSGVHLVLDDAFAKRTFVPVQHLHFDEVIPEEERITDITTALGDRGFTVTPYGPEDDPERRLLYARKNEGPDEMALWLFVRGRRYDTERQNRMSGHTFTTTLNTGELKVFMGGTLPRDSRDLTHEMNALQRALRERFGWLRAPR